MFEIKNLRKPFHMLDLITKKQLKNTTEKHKKIDNAFLNQRIKPRVIIFMEDGTNLAKLKQERNENLALFEKKGPNNVAINVNKFIAKYDFDIAIKLKPDLEKEEEDERDENEIRQTFHTNAILEILQICSNELAKENEYYQSLWTLDGKQINNFDDLDPETKILLCSHLPMFDFKSAAHLGISKRRQQTLKNRNTDPKQLNSGSNDAPVQMSGLQGNEF